MEYRFKVHTSKTESIIRTSSYALAEKMIIRCVGRNEKNRAPKWEYLGSQKDSLHNLPTSKLFKTKTPDYYRERNNRRKKKTI